jgi:hypothetical protein
VWRRQAFTGVVDELRMWRTVRTDEQIRASYDRGIAMPADGTQAADPSQQSTAEALSLYWRFDEPGLVRGTTTRDMSGHDSDGLVGMMPTIRNELQSAAHMDPSRSHTLTGPC